MMPVGYIYLRETIAYAYRYLWHTSVTVFFSLALLSRMIINELKVQYCSAAQVRDVA